MNVLSNIWCPLGYVAEMGALCARPWSFEWRVRFFPSGVAWCVNFLAVLVVANGIFRFLAKEGIL